MNAGGPEVNRGIGRTEIPSALASPPQAQGMRSPADSPKDKEEWKEWKTYII
jgi:hypothetical protein